MTGPEHFTEAVRLLEYASQDDNAVNEALLIARAQVHATLAQAAAIAGIDEDNDADWAQAFSL